LEQLATSVVAGVAKLTDSQKKLLEDIKDEIEKIIANLVVEHAEDVSEVSAANAAIANCVAKQNGISISSHNSETARASHSTCRTAEATKYTTKKTTCDLYVTTASAPGAPECMYNFPRAPKQSDFADMEVCVGKIFDWAKNWFVSLTTKKGDCDTATTEHTTQKTDCDAQQHAYEQNFCSYRQTLEVKCAEYSACRTDAIAAEATVHEGVKLDEAARKATYSSAKHVTCYLGVLAATAKKQPEELKKCKDTASYDTSHLDIAYPVVPAEVVCNTSPVSTYPCETAWTDAHYTSKPWHGNAATVACTPCAALPALATAASGAASAGGGSAGAASSASSNFGKGPAGPAVVAPAGFSVEFENYEYAVLGFNTKKDDMKKGNPVSSPTQCDRDNWLEVPAGWALVPSTEHRPCMAIAKNSDINRGWASAWGTSSLLFGDSLCSCQAPDNWKQGTVLKPLSALDYKEENGKQLFKTRGCPMKIMIRKWVGAGPEPPVTKPVMNRPVSHYKGYNYAEWSFMGNKHSGYGANAGVPMPLAQPEGWEFVPDAEFGDVCLNFIADVSVMNWGGVDWGGNTKFYNHPSKHECGIGHSEKMFNHQTCEQESCSSQTDGWWKTSLTTSYKGHKATMSRMETGGSSMTATNQGPLFKSGNMMTYIIRQQAAAPPPMYSTTTAFVWRGYEFALYRQDASRDTTYDSFKAAGGITCDDIDHTVVLGELTRHGWQEFAQGPFNKDEKLQDDGSGTLQKPWDAQKVFYTDVALGTDYGWGTQFLVGVHFTIDTKTGKKTGNILNNQACNDHERYAHRSQYWKDHGILPGYSGCRHVNTGKCDAKVLVMRKL